MTMVIKQCGNCGCKSIGCLENLERCCHCDAVSRETHWMRETGDGEGVLLVWMERPE